MTPEALGAALIELSGDYRFDGGEWPNERHLHHHLSHLLQAEHELVVCPADGNRQACTLHPEWPTFKKATGIAWAKYRKEGTAYYPEDVTKPKKKGGFLDFAIGAYDQPPIGIEITSGYGCQKEAVAYDLVKLLDSRNPFKAVFSLNLVLRKNPKTDGVELRERMDEAANKAARRLRDFGLKLNLQRRVWVVVVELDKNADYNAWYLTPQGFHEFRFNGVGAPADGGQTGDWSGLLSP